MSSQQQHQIHVFDHKFLWDITRGGKSDGWESLKTLNKNRLVSCRLNFILNPWIQSKLIVFYYVDIPLKER